MKKVLIVFLVLALTAAFALTAMASSGTQATEQAIQNSITADANNDAALKSAEVKDDTIAKVDVKTFKSQFSELLTELNQLKTQCNGLWSQIKDLNQSIKTEWSSLKDSLKSEDKADRKSILTSLKAKIDSLRTQVKSNLSDIKALRNQKKTEWTNFRAAVKARDAANASASLNNIINLKKQIISKQTTLLQLKQEILNTLKSVITNASSNLTNSTNL